MPPDEQIYKTAVPLLELAEKAAGRRIHEAFRRLGDPHLVKQKVMEHRIKAFESLQRKARDRNWSIHQAMKKANDLVGYRVVCNNLQDVERAAELLTEALSSDAITAKCRDYIRRPSPQGYRGIHLSFALPIQDGQNKMAVGCEIQIRTVLQDSWAHLSRTEIYTREAQLAPSLLKEMKRLSDQLERADRTANRIRIRISQRLPVSQPVRTTSRLSKAVLGFLYHRTYSEPAPEYVLLEATRSLEGTPVRSDGLESILRDQSFQKKLASAFSANFPGEIPTDHAQRFRWSVLASIHGFRAAISAARKEGQEFWEEGDAIYRHDLLSELPETWQGFVETLEHRDHDDDPSHYLQGLADVLGGLKSCAICSTKIVSAETLADALTEYYKSLYESHQQERHEEDTDTADDEEEESEFDEDAVRLAIEAAISHSGIEIGYWDNSSYCSYHGDVLSRND